MNTFGWDTVFVLTMDRANQALASGGSQLLTSISVRTTQPINMELNGQFTSWKIVPGGSGKLLHLQLTFGSGTITVANQNASLNGVGVVVEVSLDLLPESGAQQVLRFSMLQAGKPGDAGKPGVVTPVTVVNAQALPPQHVAMLLEYIPQYLVQNASRISYALATVNLFQPGSGSWLAPRQCDYAFERRVNAPDCLAVLGSMTAGNISGLPRQIDPALMQAGNTGAFLFTGDLFLEHVVLPMVPTTLRADAKNFYFDSGQHAIRNHNSFGAVSVKKGAVTYHPSIDSFTMTVNGGSLQTQLSGSCDLGLNISMSFSITINNAVVFDPSSQTLRFQPDANPSQHHDSHIPWYDYFLGPIPDIIMAAVVPSIAGGIADNLTQFASSSTIASKPPTPVHWTGMGSFSVKAAGLETALYLRGDVYSALGSHTD